MDSGISNDLFDTIGDSEYIPDCISSISTSSSMDIAQLDFPPPATIGSTIICTTLLFGIFIAPTAIGFGAFDLSVGSATTALEDVAATIEYQMSRTLSRGTGGIISGFANDAGDLIPHAMLRMWERGITPEQVINAVNNGIIWFQDTGRIAFWDGNIRVVIDSLGRFVTTFPEH